MGRHLLQPEESAWRIRLRARGGCLRLHDDAALDRVGFGPILRQSVRTGRRVAFQAGPGWQRPCVHVDDELLWPCGFIRLRREGTQVLVSPRYDLDFRAWNRKDIVRTDSRGVTLDRPLAELDFHRNVDCWSLPLESVQTAVCEAERVLSDLADRIAAVLKEPAILPLLRRSFGLDP